MGGDLWAEGKVLKSAYASLMVALIVAGQLDFDAWRRDHLEHRARADLSELVPIVQHGFVWLSRVHQGP
jgi:hypothetical protein